MTDFERLFKLCFEKNGLDRFAAPEMTAKFERLTELLLDCNSHTNLTAIRDLPSIISKHYADSLVFEGALRPGASVIDVGCGAGFPSLPLAIARPDLSVTALDSTKKKTDFIENVKAELKLDNLSVICGRAEELCRAEPPLSAKNSPREGFDAAVARAVASLDVLSEYCLPFVKPGGKFIALKSKTAVSELPDAQGAIARLGGKFVETLPANVVAISGDGDSNEIILEHIALIIQKNVPTPKNLPRPGAQIAKKPLR